VNRLNALVLTGLLAATGTVLALAPALNAQQVAQATKAGDTMFHQEGAYRWGNYLLKTYTEDVKLSDTSPEVDGIAIGTPYERLRYESFLASFQDAALTTPQATTLASSLKNKVTFLIYTHSPRGVDDEEEQWQQAYTQGKVKTSEERAHSYLDTYKAATLTAGGRTLSATPQLDGPYTDQFTLPTGGAQFRYLGVVRYTFDVSGVSPNSKVTLNFKDSLGKGYSQTANLSQLQ